MSKHRIIILYFASLGEQLGCTEEILALNDRCTVSELIQRLGQRGINWQTLLSACTTRCAVNQQICGPKHTISPGDEIAFFPPVTGG